MDLAKRALVVEKDRLVVETTQKVNTLEEHLFSFQKECEEWKSMADRLDVEKDALVKERRKVLNFIILPASPVLTEP